MQDSFIYSLHLLAVVIALAAVNITLTRIAKSLESRDKP